jgi:hypothetical protein
MTQVMPQLQGTLFEMGDFPPVALLVSSLKENNIDGKTFVKDMVNFLDGQDGTNTHPLFIETIISWIEQGGDFAPLITASDVKPESIEYFIETKQISETFLKHCIRFRIMPANIIDWTVILNHSWNKVTEPNVATVKYGTPKKLDIDDAYYLTAVANKINVPAYRVFSKINNKLDENYRLEYSSIKKYYNLQKRLHEEGQQYPSKQVFTVADLYNIEDIIKLVNANHTLEEVILFNKFGLLDVEEIIENAPNIPREWLEVIE